MLQQMKSQRDKIRQYQRRIEQNMERDRDLARQLLRDGKKERAKLLLRKKRYQEQLLEKTDGHLENIEKMIHDVEFSQVELQVMNGLKAGNEALKKIHDVLTVDEVERILDETREGVEKQREIDELISGALTEEDEAAVEEELEALVGPTLPEVPMELPEAPSELPEVPMELPQEPSQEEPGTFGLSAAGLELNISMLSFRLGRVSMDERRGKH
ncbi:hypothetical protein PR048_014612 [Dryococelus australis]|uniref:Charged multivesicular body protein 6 n=1 Tax=Dryococelus australis TaxID=614101 RepID=A0ABQ9HER3_9NEOP|nr:hypothetical protein PR048_014612 [Dryococelus australis]